MAERGRPKWIPDESTLERVKEMAARGMTGPQIADNLGISYTTLRERKKEFAAFALALQGGAAKGIEEMVNFLFEQAKIGNMRAIELYLKCRGGWRETTILEMPNRKFEEMTDEELHAIIEGRKV